MQSKQQAATLLSGLGTCSGTFCFAALPVAKFRSGWFTLSKHVLNMTPSFIFGLQLDFKAKDLQVY